MTVREPAVAGIFYAASRSTLNEQIETCFRGRGGPGELPCANPSRDRRILGLVCPHAGYIYSGMIAAFSYAALAKDGLPDVAVILGPNHRSYLPEVALTPDDIWETPLGEIVIDSEINDTIASAYPNAERSVLAHQEEHSLEVQLPFLQYLAGIAGKEIRIVPLLLGSAAMSDASSFIESLGEVLSSAVAGKNAVIIASSDFTHYESRESAKVKDYRAISSIVGMDEVGLLENVRSFGITMCGVLPAAVTIAACKKLGAIAAERIAYGNSGDVSGDYSQVVGYGAVKIYK